MPAPKKLQRAPVRMRVPLAAPRSPPAGSLGRNGHASSGLSAALNILLLLFGAVLPVVVDYLANTAGVSAPAFRLLQRWALPLLGITLVLTIGAQVLLCLLERPPSLKRI